MTILFTEDFQNPEAVTQNDEKVKSLFDNHEEKRVAADYVTEKISQKVGKSTELVEKVKEAMKRNEEKPE